ncbi:MAG: M23 family peptidase [Actinobacteria bacterium]|nr:MAG: M23 family peptidase [Actinomycetota bacterium]
MAGKFSGALVIAALFGGLLLLAAPGEAAEGECGPITLDMLFPHLDVHGNPLPTTTTLPPQDSTTTTAGDTSTTDHSSTTSTTGATTTTSPETTTTSPPEPICRSWVYEMEWPLGIDSHVISGFGADRDGGARRHKGNDLVTPKLAPVVAVADGTVSSIHSTPPDDCCWLLITHDDGWQSLYVHLNNDTYLTDDGLGHGVRPGLAVGSRVEAGHVIGWIGDSGNAEDTVPHLHFELRHPEGYSVDPYSSLQAAKAGLELPWTSSPYLDLDGLAIGLQASSMLTNGIFWPCDERGLEFCPTRLAQPEDTADLLAQLTGLAPPTVETRAQLIRLQQAVPDHLLPLVLGCSPIEECLQTGITAGDVARMALWANFTLRGADAASFDTTSDLRMTDSHQAETGLRILGRIGFCHESVDDETLINRAEAARLLLWWVLGEGQTSCVESSDPTS